MKVSRISRIGMIGVLVLALVTLASPAFAQGGTLRGKVIDDQNKPVNGAKITMVETGTNRKFETKTDSKGEWRQIGLSPGNYTVTADKDGLSQMFEVRVGLDTKEVNFALGQGSKMTAEQAKKEAARVEGIKTAFAEGAIFAVQLGWNPLAATCSASACRTWQKSNHAIERADADGVCSARISVGSRSSR